MSKPLSSMRNGAGVFPGKNLAAALLLIGAALHGEESSRARRIEERLLAPCCYSESVAQHRSELAVATKREIRQLIAQQKSDDEVVAVFTARYGRRILVEPDGGAGAVLIVMPVLAIAAGVMLTALVIRKLRRRAPAVAHAAPVELPDVPDF